MTYENRTTNGRQINDKGSGLEFYGTEGTLFVDRQGFDITPESKRDEGQFVDRMLSRRQGATTPDNPSHARNFIDCVKSRKAPICDIEIGHRSSSAALLGNVALRSGGTVAWDGKTETVTNGNAKATALLDVAYRAPWKLTV
jgi:predicted dehydrogenase